MDTNTNIAEIGLTEIEGEPRARDLDVGERLGFARPRNIRPLIERHRVALEAFGPISLYREAKSGAGRPDEGFWLNEQQALYIGAKSDAPNASVVLTMLINVYTAWRRGHLPQVDQQSLARQIAAIVDDKLARHNAMLTTQMLPGEVARHLNERHMVLLDGLSAGEVCDLSNVADDYPRGISGRVAHRLARFCKANGVLPWYTRVGKVKAKAYPTHLAREWLDIEGRALIRRWYQDKIGQSALRLVGGRAA